MESRRKTILSPPNIHPKILAGKFLCKKDLLATFGLPPERVEKPLLGIVSRFAGQKGFDLIDEIAADLLDEDVTIVALGAGEPKYELMFRELAAASLRDRWLWKIAYDDYRGAQDRSGRGYVSDAFAVRTVRLKSDMFSLKYCSVPIVHATGGL